MAHPARRSLVRTIACATLALQSALIAGSAAAETEGTAAPQAADAPLSADAWRARTETDLAAFADALRENFIHAAYPDPDGWHTWFDDTLATVEAGLPRVRDEAGYQAVLRHLAATFQDAHVSVTFESPSSRPPHWAGFLARFDSATGTYRVTASQQPEVPDGAEVSACDGTPVASWIATIAQYEIGLPDTLESTRFDAAPRLFVDRGNPLRPRPAHCTIDGRRIALDWSEVSSQTLGSLIQNRRGGRTPGVDTRHIGDDGAWVTLGYFQPADAQQAEAFHAAIAAAPALRDKRFIVLDVRGNGGGPYSWFMAYLRGLYGQAYADHYATARLHIRAVHRLSPAFVELLQEMKARDGDHGTPSDPPLERHAAADDARRAQAIAAGDPLFHATPPSMPRGAAPENPVRAQVYVLTDYACASACIALVDELERFPGVQQIGLPTFVDNRSGTSVPIPLPSGQATAMIATMTRDGRIRDDNAPQVPSIRFDGDIFDDAAVEAWVVQDVLAEE